VAAFIALIHDGNNHGIYTPFFYYAQKMIIDNRNQLLNTHT